MRIQQFQVSIVESTRKHLPRNLREFQARAFFSLVKIFYAEPKIHYEVWVRGEDRLIEVGLHFEADKATNDALRNYFSQRTIELRAELGARIEVEEWTNSWSRVHEVVPYTALDQKTADEIAGKLARMIATLEPMRKQWRKHR
ncbi:MAG: hypothetical protein HY327_08490 [Chloroflexi bacterium]|nr:hypothetical protein [Chloroflexota bacterium]